MGESVARSMHFAAHAILLQLLGGAHHFERHRAPGDERDVRAFAQAEADVERQRLPVVRHFLPHEAIQPHGLEEHHRVRIADGGEQQAVGARRRRRAHDAQARDDARASPRDFPSDAPAHGCRRREACASPSAA